MMRADDGRPAAPSTGRQFADRPRCCEAKAAAPSRCASPPATRSAPSAPWSGGRGRPHVAAAGGIGPGRRGGGGRRRLHRRHGRRVARAAGARVAGHATAAAARAGPWPPALEASMGDLVVFLDADVENTAEGFVPRPARARCSVDDDVALVKGFYERPLHGQPAGGGRVTELVARPLIELLFPELVEVRQPLAGETAAHRWVLEKVELRRRLRRGARPPGRRGPPLRRRVDRPGRPRGADPPQPAPGRAAAPGRRGPADRARPGRRRRHRPLDRGRAGDPGSVRADGRRRGRLQPGPAVVPAGRRRPAGARPARAAGWPAPCTPCWPAPGRPGSPRP